MTHEYVALTSALATGLDRAGRQTRFLELDDERDTEIEASVALPMKWGFPVAAMAVPAPASASATAPRAATAAAAIGGRT